MNQHDCLEPGHDKDVHLPLSFLHTALVGRQVVSVRAVSTTDAVMQTLHGPSGKPAPLGRKEGGLLLHEKHVTAVLPWDSTTPPTAKALASRTV